MDSVGATLVWTSPVGLTVHLVRFPISLAPRVAGLELVCVAHLPLRVARTDGKKLSTYNCDGMLTLAIPTYKRL
eukprot:6101327-Amphidinium_carterae.1